MWHSIVAGNVGKEPELRQAGQTDVLGFSVAVTMREKGGNETQWIEVSIFGARARALQPYIHKGSKIVVAGQMKLREYEVKVEGALETRVSVELSADDITLQDPAPAQGSGGTAPRGAASAGGAPRGRY
jgi:single-strand DNA-binding protein